MAKQLQWEYKVVPVSLEALLMRYKAYLSTGEGKLEKFEGDLAKLGAEGWELVNVYSGQFEGEFFCYAFLKRPKQTA